MKQKSYRESIKSLSAGPRPLAFVRPILNLAAAFAAAAKATTEARARMDFPSEVRVQRLEKLAGEYENLNAKTAEFTDSTTRVARELEKFNKTLKRQIAAATKLLKKINRRKP